MDPIEPHVSRVLNHCANQQTAKHCALFSTRTHSLYSMQCNTVPSTQSGYQVMPEILPLSTHGPCRHAHAMSGNTAAQTHNFKLHNPMNPISTHTACCNATPKHSAHTSTDKQYRRVPSDLTYKFTFWDRNFWYSKQNSDKHILNVLQPLQQHTIAQSLQWLSYDLNDRGIMVRFPVGTRDFFSLLWNAKVGFGAHRRPLASVVRAQH